MMTLSHLKKICREKSLRMTAQRRVIIRVLSESHDHPAVEEVYQRIKNIDPKISLATLYRTLRLFQEAHILKRHEFGDGISRYENASVKHHHHLIDKCTGEIIEFHDDQLEALQQEIAKKLGYELVGHRLELYGVPFGKDKKKK
ncbi:MAG TPA: transcriptional repressor [Holosporales bacterium]|nr:transcriptional repressor [Holosporales bacterium]HBW24936.1 transcriptional repressor [Holosporales bacterium]HCC24703.1 transcriptional repressor [Holosporales bacterium]HCE96558.1 transcriptional repressor [Holosporales bacterium]